MSRPGKLPVSANANHANRKNRPRRGCSRGSSISRFTASGQCSGNLTNDGSWTLTWDAENRLVKLAAGTGVGPQISLQFDYDHQGRRIRQRVWNNKTWSGNPTNDVRYVYDGWNPLASLNPASSVRQAYLWGLDLSGTMEGVGGVGGLLAITNASHGSHFCAYDGNGNVAALVKADGAGLAAQYEYGPFGELLRATGPMAKANPFRFSTKYQDDETDLIYYGYRYYNPNTGRWPNRDPLGEKGFETALRTKRCFLCKTAELLEGPNLYAFVANDPLDYVDTDGRGKYKLPPPGPYKPPIPIEPPAPKPSWPKRLWKCAIAPVNAVTCTSCAGGLLGIEAICGGAAGGGWEGMGYSDFNSCVCDFYNDNWLLKQTCNSCFSLPIAGGIGTLFEKVVGWGN